MQCYCWKDKMQNLLTPPPPSAASWCRPCQKYFGGLSNFLYIDFPTSKNPSLKFSYLHSSRYFVFHGMKLECEVYCAAVTLGTFFHSKPTGAFHATNSDKVHIIKVVADESREVLCENQLLFAPFSIVFMKLYLVLARKLLHFSLNFKMGVAISRDPNKINSNWQFFLAGVPIALFHAKLQLIIFENVICGIFLLRTYFFNYKAFFSSNFCKYAIKIDITADLPQLWLWNSKNSDNSA